MKNILFAAFTLSSLALILVVDSSAFAYGKDDLILCEQQVFEGREIALEIFKSRARDASLGVQFNDHTLEHVTNGCFGACFAKYHVTPDAYVIGGEFNQTGLKDDRFEISISPELLTPNQNGTVKVTRGAGYAGGVLNCHSTEFVGKLLNSFK